ncbi:MAG: hypothetical protein P8L33_00780 [Gammaproteobacteria bacterium]|nr:hypothetical protein [Gammaproteobacteria bacterium]
MNKIIFISLTLIITGCAKSIVNPLTGLIMPEYNADSVNANDYGAYPKDYQKILKDYLQNKLINHEDAKVEFINKPVKKSISQASKIYTGYRLCLSINSKNRKSVYTGFKTHLFVINDSKIILHLYDSGLLKIPFNLCVDRKESDGMYLNEIPDKTEDILLEEMDEIDLNKRPNQSIKSKTNTYILCKVNGVERTLYFNEYNKLFVESSGINEIELSDVEFSTTHILGSNGTEEILINRVSGSIIITQSNTKPSEGMCELFDNKKF